VERWNGTDQVFCSALLFAMKAGKKPPSQSCTPAPAIHLLDRGQDIHVAQAVQFRRQQHGEVRAGTAADGGDGLVSVSA
jgi:hypothetical protein